MGVGMGKQRKTYLSKFKAKVALAAVRSDKTVNELASEFEVHATLVHLWKKTLVGNAEVIFEGKAKASKHDPEAEKAELFEQIGRLKMELEWLKKKADRFG